MFHQQVTPRHHCGLLASAGQLVAPLGLRLRSFLSLGGCWCLLGPKTPKDTTIKGNIEPQLMPKGMFFYFICRLASIKSDVGSCFVFFHNSWQLLGHLRRQNVAKVWWITIRIEVVFLLNCRIFTILALLLSPVRKHIVTFPSHLRMYRFDMCSIDFWGHAGTSTGVL